MSDYNLFHKRTSAAALASLALISLAALALPSPASAQSVAARHKAALAAKAKAAKAKTSSAISPLPSTGAGAGTFANSGNAPAPRGTPLDPVMLYSGAPLASVQVQAMAWGGGVVADHNGEAYTAAGHTIQIDTAGLYQGGQIAFSTPVTLGDLKAQTTRYLQIIFSAAPSQKYPGYNSYRSGGVMPLSLFPPMDAHYQFLPGSYQIAQAPYPPGRGGFGGRGGARGGYGTPPGGYRPPSGGYGVPGGQRGTGSTTPGMDEVDALPQLAIGTLHVLYEYADGTRSETLRPISVTLGEDINWLRASIPLSAIPASPSGSAQLAKLYIGTDVPATLNIGEIRLITDTTALTADAGSNKTVPVNTPVILVGTGEGGASTLKYEWNFDSATGAAFVPEAEGVTAQYTYSTPGDHIVTLRVSDLDGIKPSATAVVTIHVEDQDAIPGGMQGMPGMPGASGMPPYGMGRPNNQGYRPGPG